MNKVTKIFLASTLAFTLFGCSSKGAEDDTIKVAVIKQLDHASLDEIATAITDELDAIAEKEGVKIEYGEVYSGQNDQTTLQQIASQALGDGVDVMIPIATLAAQVSVNEAQESSTPVVFAAISDPETAGLTGLKNVTGTSDALNTEQIIDMMLTQNPDLKKVGLLYSKSEPNSEKPIAQAKEILDSKNIEYVEACGNTTDEIISATASLVSEKVEAVFTPTDNVVMAAELAIADTFKENGIAHYAGADSFVRSGALTTCGVNYTDLGKKTADLAYEAVTKGMDDMDDYVVMDGGIITVNTETAQALNVDPSIYESFGTLVETETTGE